MQWINTAPTIREIFKDNYLHKKEEGHAVVPSTGEKHKHGKVQKRYRLLRFWKSAEHDGTQELILELKDGSGDKAEVIVQRANPLVHEALLHHEKLEVRIQSRYFIV